MHFRLNFVDYYSSDISNLRDDEFMSRLFDKHNEAYLIQTLYTIHADKIEYTSKIDGLVKMANRKNNVFEVDLIKIKPLLYLQVLKIEKVLSDE